MGCINDVLTIQVFFCNSSKDFLNEIDPLIILPSNLACLEWMERMKDVKWDGSVDDETEKGVVFIDLPLMITIFLDLSALKVKPAIHDNFFVIF